MKIKKAVLLVLTNKTKGSVLSSEGVYGVLNPVKQKGIMLDEGGTISNLIPLLQDINSTTEVITTTIFYNRSIVNDKFDQIDVVNLQFTKPLTDSFASSDSPILGLGVGLVDNLLNGDVIDKDIIKAFQDQGISVDKFSVSLTKNFKEVNEINEVLAKILGKVRTETVNTNEFAVLTSSKTFVDSFAISDQSSLEFVKNAQDIGIAIEDTILSFSKSISDNTVSTEIFVKDIDKPLKEETASVESPALQVTKPFDDLLVLADLSIREVQKAVVELSENIEKIIFDVFKILSEGLQNSDTPQKSLSKIASNFFTTLDSVIVTLLKEKNIADTIISVDDVVSSVTKNIRDFSFTDETLVFGVDKTLQDFNQVIETIIKNTDKVLDIDITNSNDIPAKDFTKVLHSSVLLQDIFTFSFSKSLSESTVYDLSFASFIKRLLDDNIVESSAALNVIKSVFDTFTTQDNSSLSPNKGIQDGVFTLDQIVVLIDLMRTLSDIVSNNESASLNFSKVNADQVSYTDVIERLLIINRTLREEDFQDYVDNEQYFLEDYVKSGSPVRHSDNMIRNFVKGLADSNSPVDTIFLALLKNVFLSDTVTSTESISLQANKLLDDLVSITDDTFSKNVNKQPNEFVNFAESTVKSVSKTLEEISSHVDNITTVLTMGLTFLKNFIENVTLTDEINISSSKIVFDENDAAEKGSYIIQDYVGTYQEYVDNNDYFLENYVISEGDYFLEDYVGKSLTFDSRAFTVGEVVDSNDVSALSFNRLTIDLFNDYSDITYFLEDYVGTYLQTSVVQYSDTINISKNKTIKEVVVNSDTGSVFLYNFTEDTTYFEEQYVGEFSTLT